MKTVTKAKAQKIIAKLEELYPNPECALHHRNTFELLVATILSAQCTDERVNMVTPALFEAYPTPGMMAEAPLEHIEELIRSTGFFRNKAKNLIACARDLTELHHEEVPCEMKALTALAGVGRKTANVILGNAFGINEGVVVDTHVKRLSGKLGFSNEETPEKIEKDLMKLFARDSWTELSHLLILHGRALCNARSPKCDQCPIAPLCRYAKNA